MRWRRIVLGALGAAVLAAAGFALWIGPRNVVGMLLYDQRREGQLRVGDPAPDVVLAGLDGRGVRLSEQIGKRPLVLIFGSFTWPPFRRSVERLHEIAREHEGRASFLTVYIKEAHPTDEWQVASNERDGVCYPQPRTLEERLAIARDFVVRHDYRIPLAVDDLADRADELYAGWPERLYVVGTDGRIAFKGRTGPFGFEPDEVDAWLDRLEPGR